MKETDASKGGKGERDGLRSRIVKEPKVSKTKKGDSDTQNKAEKHRLPPWSISERQYAGLHIALLGAVLCVTSYAQSLWAPKVQVLAGLFVALVGLFLHETRPFRRRGYGDLMDQDKTS